MPNRPLSNALTFWARVASGPALADGVTAVTLLSGGLAEVTRVMR